MLNPQVAAAIYSFEALLPELSAPPIAARRAMDHAGQRLALESWRSLPLDDREQLVLLGLPERVDTEAVAQHVRRAIPPAQRVAVVTDPDSSQPPEALVRALDPARSLDGRRWSRLRAIDRYALIHTYRRAVARGSLSVLSEAFDAIVTLLSPHPPPMPTPAPPRATYQPAGFYSRLGDEGEAPPPKVEDPRARADLRTPRSSWIPPRMPTFDSAIDAGRDASAARDSASAPRRSNPPPATPAPARTAKPERSQASSPLPAREAISTHLNPGGEVHMVDVGPKPTTERRAVAAGEVRMMYETAERLSRRDASLPKGEVLATARVAGIMAAKRTHELIPLCHPIALTRVTVDLTVDVDASAVYVRATAEAVDRTGVEMEAMVAVSAACLTIYDMLKGVDREMVIGEIKLMEKSGGRTGHYVREGAR